MTEAMRTIETWLLEVAERGVERNPYLRIRFPLLPGYRPPSEDDLPHDPGPGYDYPMTRGNTRRQETQEQRDRRMVWENRVLLPKYAKERR